MVNIAVLGACRSGVAAASLSAELMTREIDFESVESFRQFLRLSSTLSRRTRAFFHTYH